MFHFLSILIFLLSSCIFSRDNGLSSGADSGSLPQSSLQGFIINNSNEYTRTLDVSITLFSDEAKLVSITNSRGCTGDGIWQELEDKISWKLKYSNSINWVSVKFKNNDGTISECYESSLTHDDIAPEVSSIFRGEGTNFSSSFENSVQVLDLDGDISSYKIYSDKNCNSNPYIEKNKNSGLILVSPEDKYNDFSRIYYKLVDHAGNYSSCKEEYIFITSELPNISNLSSEGVIDSYTRESNISISWNSYAAGAFKLFVDDSCSTEMTSNRFSLSDESTIGVPKYFVEPIPNSTNTLGVKGINHLGETECLSITFFSDYFEFEKILFDNDELSNERCTSLSFGDDNIFCVVKFTNFIPNDFHNLFSQMESSFNYIILKIDMAGNPVKALGFQADNVGEIYFHENNLYHSSDQKLYKLDSELIIKAVYDIGYNIDNFFISSGGLALVSGSTSNSVFEISSGGMDILLSYINLDTAAQENFQIGDGTNYKVKKIFKDGFNNYFLLVEEGSSSSLIYFNKTSSDLTWFTTGEFVGNEYANYSNVSSRGGSNLFSRKDGYLKYFDDARDFVWETDIYCEPIDLKVGINKIVIMCSSKFIVLNKIDGEKIIDRDMGYYDLDENYLSLSLDDSDNPIFGGYEEGCVLFCSSASKLDRILIKKLHDY